jgi:hypothetical protein
MPQGSATTQDAVALAQALKTANTTLHDTLWLQLRVLANDVFKEAAATPMIQWEREFDRYTLSSGFVFSGSSQTPMLRWSKNVTDKVKDIIKAADKDANPDNFLEDARIIIYQELEVLLGKSGLKCRVGSGREQYIKEHDLDEELEGKLVVVHITYQV